MNLFLAKFGIDASEMISSDLSFASSRMGLATMIMQDPEVTGLFSPGGGFEIVATGKVTAPELPADASKLFVIVQDFKEGNSDSANEGYGKPIAAVFALYESMYTYQAHWLMFYVDDLLFCHLGHIRTYLAQLLKPWSNPPNTSSNILNQILGQMLDVFGHSCWIVHIYEATLGKV